MRDGAEAVQTLTLSCGHLRLLQLLLVLRLRGEVMLINDDRGWRGQGVNTSLVAVESVHI